MFIFKQFTLNFTINSKISLYYKLRETFQGGPKLLVRNVRDEYLGSRFSCWHVLLQKQARIICLVFFFFSLVDKMSQLL